MKAGLLQDLEGLGWTVDFQGHDHFTITESAAPDATRKCLLTLVNAFSGEADDQRGILRKVSPI